jgi:hypothetical protein
VTWLDGIAPRESPHALAKLQRLALTIAREDVGKGEGAANNSGPYIEFIRSMDGTGRGPGGRGAWCATFVSSCFARAAAQLGYRLPFAPTRGARALYRRIGKAGRFISAPHEIEPGDVMCWRRTIAAGDWRGHVEIVEFADGPDVSTIGGNRGPYPSVVRRYRYQVGGEYQKGRLLGFSRLW